MKRQKKMDAEASPVVTTTTQNARFGKSDKRGGKGYSKPQGRPVYSKGPNDIKWRSSTLLAKLAGTLPFGYPSGLGFMGALRHVYNGAVAGQVMPMGIMAIRLLVTLGRANNYNAGLNLAVRKIYSFIRHANSGSKNYEAADLAMYFGSWGQGAAMLSWLQRLYRLVCSFSSTNRYTPRELITVNGVNYDDIKKHQAELAWLIRWFGNALNSLCVPKMPYFDAAYYTFSKVFKDNDSPKNQFYLFVPDGFGVYNPTYDSNGGGIDFATGLTHSIPAPSGTLLTYSDLFDNAHALMDVLLSDEDVGIMSGDILKAYGDGGLFKCNAEPDSELIAEHSPEILQQIHNCTVVPKEMVYLKGYNQDPGTTSTAPFVKVDAGVGSGVYVSGPSDVTFAVSQYIDAFSKEPDSNEVINCCVLKASCRLKHDSGSGNNYIGDVTTLDHDLYLPVQIITVAGTGTTVQYNQPTISGRTDGIKTPCLLASYTNTGLFNSGAYLMTQFDWHPLIITGDAATMSAFGGSIFGDVQNINFFDDVVFTRIHDTAILSLFGFVE